MPTVNNIAYVECAAPIMKVMLNGTGGDSIFYYEVIARKNVAISYKYSCTFIWANEF
jgi:hypothetical protein